MLFFSPSLFRFFFFFFFNDTATTEIYTLSLHDALPISFPSGWRGWPSRFSHSANRLQPAVGNGSGHPGRKIHGSGRLRPEGLVRISQNVRSRASLKSRRRPTLSDDPPDQPGTGGEHGTGHPLPGENGSQIRAAGHP